MKHTVTWNDRSSFSRLHVKYTIAFVLLIMLSVVTCVDISNAISYSFNVEEEILLSLKRAVNMRRARREMFELVRYDVCALSRLFHHFVVASRHSCREK